MSFLNRSTSFTRFAVIDPVPSDLWPSVEQRLKQFAFMDIDKTSEEVTSGWVCFDNMLDTEWKTAPAGKGDYITFSLRVDTRRIPAAVLKKHTLIAFSEEEDRNKAQGKQFISRERKKELREQAKLRLLSHFLPVPSVFNVIWSPTTGIVYFAATQSKICDLFIEQFAKTFDLRLEPIAPYQLASTCVGEAGLAKIDALQATQFATR